MLDAHVSQMYEWLPWLRGQLAEVPKDAAARKKWLAVARPSEMKPEWKDAAAKWYGAAAGQIARAEAFEITEYGRQPADDEIRKLLPVFP
jgi:hypothetical protein